MSFPKLCLFVKTLALALVLAGCSSGAGSQNDFGNFDLSSLESLATSRYIQIHIDTKDDMAEKIRIAEDAIEIVEPGLNERIASRFPGVKPWQLDTIKMEPKFELWYRPEIATWTQDIYVEISLGFSGDDAWAILQFCAEEMHAAIKKVVQSSP